MSRDPPWSAAPPPPGGGVRSPVSSVVGVSSVVAECYFENMWKVPSCSCVYILISLLVFVIISIVFISICEGL